ncbi:hypothetical protein HY085_03500 [Candidatus Gottesmanbacteria bacterium]|nr:hypothetical protein [Candidatus Gottesmanbacteria bacterium]
MGEIIKSWDNFVLVDKAGAELPKMGVRVEVRGGFEIQGKKKRRVQVIKVDFFEIPKRNGGKARVSTSK